MASRTEQKAQARAERLAREQAEAAARSRRQRLSTIAGVVLVGVIVAVVAIVISSSHHEGTTASAATQAATQKTSAAARAADARVDTLLAGIPEPSDNVLGKASAPVSIIEYGDLECSVCDSFALSTSTATSDGTAGSGVEDQIITDLVRTGKAKLVYRSLDTATSNGVTPNEFVPQQAAAYAAGLQGKAWYYIELFYNEQGGEGTDYVTQSYLDGIARQIPGLDYAKWLKDSTSATLQQQVKSEIASGTKIDQGAASTPTVLVSGRKGEQIVANGIPSFSDVESAIKAVE